MSGSGLCQSLIKLGDMASKNLMHFADNLGKDSICFSSA